MSSPLPRHHARRAAQGHSTHRWSRLPLESCTQVAAVEYRIFRDDGRGTLLREHVIVPADAKRRDIAQSLVAARGRLSIRHAEVQTRSRRTPAKQAFRATLRRFANWSAVRNEHEAPHR